MKQTYIKPQLNIESFALTQSIASGCGVAGGGNTFGKPNHWSKDTCGWDMGNIILFTTTDYCDEDYLFTADEEIFGICYNNPDGGSSIYGSY